MAQGAIAAGMAGRDRGIALAAGMVVLLGALGLGAAHGWRQGALWVVGAALGLALYHAAFGFAGAFRALLREGRGAGLRAQMLMLAAAVLLFQPALAGGELFGQPVRGFVFPVGVGVLVGAFLFGIGMQIGGGCASGTLYAAGGGGVRNLLTLLFFVAGATLAASLAGYWQSWPALPPVSLPETLGLWPAVGLALLVFALVWWGSARIERRRHGRAEPILGGRAALLTGPWPLAWGALALALLNFATLALAGHPWGITGAFPLWGSMALDRLGWADPAFWTYWEDPTRAEALFRPLLSNRITVLNLGLVAGALLAAGLAGRFAPDWRIGLGPALASVSGGLLLGTGAVLAFGCNISAYFSGIASGSLHGWVWILPALLGNWVGLRLRPLFRLGSR
ncbi:YeeE/YedE family protein [Crenalkalicoccus roseus]|uniref:YeeE/YedE family protein n=1 Tax=Crenalkalicoccus roseus TaxID=1485588 RepID=UPI0019599DB9|nr:YeeE/YedE family protein [Crenalkalicoccus roseus]